MYIYRWLLSANSFTIFTGIFLTIRENHYSFVFNFLNNYAGLGFALKVMYWHFGCDLVLLWSMFRV